MNFKMKGLLILALGFLVFTSCKKEPSASFTASQSTAEVGEVVKFTDASENAAKYYWDFGDGKQEAFDRAVSPTHIYQAEGTYTVSLLVENEKGNQTSTDSTTIEITKGLDSNETEEEQETEAEKEIRLEIMSEVWNLDRFERTDYVNGSIDNQAPNIDQNFDSTTFEFVSERNYIRNDENDNESTGSWGTLKDDRVDFMNEIFEIETLNSTDMVLKRVERSIDPNNNDVLETEWIYTFSR